MENSLEQAITSFKFDNSNFTWKSRSFSYYLFNLIMKSVRAPWRLWPNYPKFFAFPTASWIFYIPSLFTRCRQSFYFETLISWRDLELNFVHDMKLLSRIPVNKNDNYDLPLSIYIQSWSWSRAASSRLEPSVLFKKSQLYRCFLIQIVKKYKTRMPLSNTSEGIYIRILYKCSSHLLDCPRVRRAINYAPYLVVVLNNLQFIILWHVRKVNSQKCFPKTNLYHHV